MLKSKEMGVSFKGVATNNSLSAADFLPNKFNLKALRASAGSCKGCELYRDATQTVFGEGSDSAKVMLIGEQPGDMEDRQDHPFVGPAGRLLDKALTEAEISRQEVYVTTRLSISNLSSAANGACIRNR